jgi:spermidine synthase
MFLTTLVTLALQVCASRILSVTQSYHYAFLIVAFAMLGMAASAVTVFVEQQKGDGGKSIGAPRALAIGALLLVGSTFGFAFGGDRIVVVLAEGALACAFFFCGYVVAFVLARWAKDVARVYLYDLLGASLGCVVAVLLLDRTSPLNVMLACSAALAVAGMLLSRDKRFAILAAAIGALALAAFVVPGITRVRYAKIHEQKDVIWERWNSLARVTVRSYSRDPEHPIGMPSWGISRKYQGTLPEILWLELDADAGTALIRGGGSASPEALDFLKWDVTSTAYWLRASDKPKVMIIGGGAGRDVLTALTFGAPRVDVIEINPAVIAAAKGAFGDYGGHVYDRPEVHLTIGNARAVLARSSARYDIIQMSMIDTYASSMTGQLVLTENTLYTREAYDIFLAHLNDDGILATTRWYERADYGEVARTMALMGDALERHGAAAPSSQIALLYNAGTAMAGPAATCLMKRSPFTETELAALTALCRDMGFTMLWPNVEGVTAHDPLDVRRTIDRDPAWMKQTPFDLAPPTDERPFFFNTRKTASSWASAFEHRDIGEVSHSSGLLTTLLLMLLVLGFRLLIWPLRETDKLGLRELVSKYRAPVMYFGGIGMGFMLVELALIQRFMVFLGHPTYGLSVVLFSLLLFTAIGSSLSARLRDPRQVRWPIAGVVVVSLVSAFVVPMILHEVEGADLAVRVIVVVLFVAPLGTCLGMVFPAGVRLLDRAGISRIVPWMWGVNGFAAVIASVIGMMIAMAWGYTAVLVAAIGCYALTYSVSGSIDR